MNTKIEINQVYRLFDHPAVYLTSGHRGIEYVRSHGEKGSICLINLIWAFGPQAARFYIPKLKALAERGITAYVIGNCLRDMALLRLLNIRCVFANQNQFLLDENIPICPTPRQCDYHAVYVAQAKPFKRLHLASKISKLCIVTYGWPAELDATRRLRDFEPMVAHADYNRAYLGFHDVAKIMHRSSCALALSRCEGAMWAATEALLAGLPVVSTRSTGGRDRYFDRRTVRIVRPNADAVLAATMGLVNEQIDPHLVRDVTLQRIEIDRKRTVAFFAQSLMKGHRHSAETIYSHLFKDGPHRTPVG